MFPSALERKLNPQMLQHMTGTAGRRGLDALSHFVCMYDEFQGELGDDLFNPGH